MRKSLRIPCARARDRLLRIAAVVVLMAAALPNGGCVSADQKRLAPPPESLAVASLSEPIGELRKTFRLRYNAAVEAHARKLRSSVPIITQDLLNMTLLRTGGSPVRFSMKSGPYLLMAHTAHPPLTVYAILSAEGFGRLSEAAREQLDAYSAMLEKAVSELGTMGLPPRTQERLTFILSETGKFATGASTRGTATRQEFAAYALSLRAAIQENLRVGANEQLVQFRAQMQAWRTQFPEERWDELRVVVLGVHQARDLYVLKLFFQWLLAEPAFETRVVYAEFPAPPVGAGRAVAEAQALELLTKVDLEHEAGRLIFGDERILQRDVMGPAAVDILRQWGSPDFMR